MAEKKALLVVDVQVAIFHLSRPIYESNSFLENIRALIDRARACAVPIIFLQHHGSQNSIFEKGSTSWQIHPSISPRDNDIVIEKNRPDAFDGTPLEDLLAQLSVRTIVVCGFATEGCIDTTVRRAYSLGFNVELVSDAHSTTDSDVLKANQIIDHHNAVLAIFSKVKKASEIDFAA
jgi:nicotinamidase-related amidase